MIPMGLGEAVREKGNWAGRFWLASRIDNRRLHVNHHVLLFAVATFATEQSPNKRRISQKRHFVPGRLDVF